MAGRGHGYAADDPGRRRQLQRTARPARQRGRLRHVARPTGQGDDEPRGTQAVRRRRRRRHLVRPAGGEHAVDTDGQLEPCRERPDHADPGDVRPARHARRLTAQTRLILASSTAEGTGWAPRRRTESATARSDVTTMTGRPSGSAVTKARITSSASTPGSENRTRTPRGAA